MSLLSPNYTDLVENVNEQLISISSPDEYLRYDPTPDNPYPRPTWSSLDQLRRRKLGLLHHGYRQASCSFSQNTYNSLWAIQRLQVTHYMVGNRDKVNSINFDRVGNFICTGGFDRDILVHNWQRDDIEPQRIETGHCMSIYYCDFTHSGQEILSGSGGGEIRLTNIETNKSDRLFKDRRPINQFSYIDAHTLAACSRNTIHIIDFRQAQPVGSFDVIDPETSRPLALYTIATHPLDSYRIATGGTSPSLLQYDLRKALCGQQSPLVCNQSSTCQLVSSCSFSKTGDKILVSHGDDDLTVHKTSDLQQIHRYQGHSDKNSLNNSVWFGEKHVLTGSDDGHLYGWDMESEHIVFSLKADLKGYVSSLCAHPQVPVLASAGYDDYVKIWEPTSEIWPQTMKWIKRRICRNMMSRRRPSFIRQHLTQGCDEETLSNNNNPEQQQQI